MSPSIKLNTSSSNSSNLPHQNVSVAPFVGYFGIGFILANALFMLFQSNLGLDALVVLVISVLFSAFVATFKFSRKYKRPMVSNEVYLLTLGGTILLWAITFIYFIVIFLWLLDDVSREVIFEMSREKPMSLSLSFMLVFGLTAISSLVGLTLFNRLLNIKSKAGVTKLP